MKNFNKNIFKNITVLYVEDDLMTMEEISYFLSKHVKKLIVAKDGEEGLELYKKYKPDIIITDIQMPKINGLQMSEEILKIDPSIPIVLTTAYSDSKYLIRAIELGIDKYIIKPINMLEILTIIQKSLFLSVENKINSGYKDYLEFILENSSSFMFVVNSNEIEYANKRLLDIFGVDDKSFLTKELLTDEKLLEFEDIKINKNWFDYISKHNNEKYLVYLKNKNSYYNRKFYLKYKYFESIDKGVYLFIDTNDEKLEKICELTKSIIEKLDEGISSKILMTELKEIINISNKE